MQRVHRTQFSDPIHIVVDTSGDKVRTKQSFATDADINVIVGRLQKGAMLSDPAVVATRQAIFGDFTELGDFQAAQNRIVKGREAFESLSSTVRARFHNEPGELLDFMADESNKAEAQKLGFIPEDPSPPEAPIVVPEPPEPVPT